MITEDNGPWIMVKRVMGKVRTIKIFMKDILEIERPNTHDRINILHYVGGILTTTPLYAIPPHSNVAEFKLLTIIEENTNNIIVEEDGYGVRFTVNEITQKDTDKVNKLIASIA